MNQTRHQRLMVLFDELCDLGLEEKRARLETLRVEDPILARDLGAMLSADEDGVSALERPPQDALAETFVPLVPTPPPQPFRAGNLPKQIGEYKVLRQIGQGGMGIVYEGEQELPHRRVAIKVIREDVASSSLRNRFVAESHTLARLNHPGIAQIYDAASTGPLLYLAMELVEGEPLTQFAERRHLDERARIELLALVCDALAHAHQKGVIHRDLKPANILVGADGQPKVLDFGIARVVANDSRDGRETLAGQLLGTPAYMSPEQTSFEAGELDLRSDVYALGVIGYELLAGRLPHDVAGRQLLEVLQIIRESSPLPLGKVRAELGGDLETIFGKALATDPADRYQSASAFADDLRRFLADEPIAARPPSILYQVGKWAQRRRGLAATLGALAVTVTAAVVTVIILYFQVDSARRGAVEARLLAESSQRDAEFARRAAENESQILAERTDALILIDARAHLREDPTLTVARLKALGKTGWREAALLAGEAHARGVARDVLVGHHGEIEDAAFSPSGKILATASKDRTLRLWDFGTRRQRVLRGHPGELLAVAYSPDGERIATGDAEGELRIWDASGTLIARGDHDGRAINSVAWAPDSAWVVAADAGGAARRWGRDGTALTTVQAVPGSIEQVAVSPDGKWIAVAGETEPVVGLVEVARNSATILRGHAGPVARVRFLPDGTLLSAGLDGTVRRWQGAASRVLARTAHEVKELRVGADGRTVAWADRQGEVGLLVGDAVRRLAEGNGVVVRDLAISPRGDLIAVGGDDHTLRLYAPGGELRRTLEGHRGRITKVLFSPSGREVVSVSDDHTVRVWPAAGAEPGVIVAPPETRMVAFAPGRPLLAAAAADHTVWLFDLAGGPPVRLDGATDIVYATVFSPDGDRLAVASRDKTVRIYGLDGKLAGTLPCPGRATKVAFSSTGLVAAAPNGPAVPLLELASGRTRLLTGHTERVNDVAFSADGKRLLTGSDDGTLRLFDPLTGTSAALGGPGSRVVRVGFVDALAVGATATGALWARDPGQASAVEAAGHDGVVRALVPIAGGGLVTAGDDGRVRTWRPLFVAGGAAGEGHNGPITTAAVGADGAIYTGGEDGKVLRWSPALQGRPAIFLKAAGPIAALAVSADDVWLAVAAEHEPLRVLPTRIDERPEKIKQFLDSLTLATFGRGDILAGPWQ